MKRQNINSIDWDDLRQGYNRIYKTNHSTVRIFLSQLYKDKKSAKAIGRILGVSYSVVLNKMRELDIARNKKGHRGKSVYQERYRAIKNKEDLSLPEIARIVKCTVSYAHALPRIIEKWDREEKQ